MARLTFDGDYCRIAGCNTTECDGKCLQKAVWTKLRLIEDILDFGIESLEPVVKTRMLCRTGSTGYGIRCKYDNKEHWVRSRFELHFRKDSLFVAKKQLTKSDEVFLGKYVFETKEEAQEIINRAKRKGENCDDRVYKQGRSNQQDSTML